MGGDLHRGVASACPDGAEALPLVPDGVRPAGHEHGYLVWPGVSRDVDVAGQPLAEQRIANEPADEKEPMSRIGEGLGEQPDSLAELSPVIVAQRWRARPGPAGRGRSLWA